MPKGAYRRSGLLAPRRLNRYADKGGKRSYRRSYAGQAAFSARQMLVMAQSHHHVRSSGTSLPSALKGNLKRMTSVANVKADSASMKEAKLDVRRPFSYPQIGSTAMTTRSKSVVVKFRRPFILGGFDTVQSAGDYVVDTEEEQIDSISVSAWRRVSTTMRVRADGATEFRSIDAEELKEALLRDGAQDDSALPPSSRMAKGRYDRARNNGKTPTA